MVPSSAAIGKRCLHCIVKDQSSDFPSPLPLDYLNSFNFSLGDLDFGSEMAGLEYGFIGDMVQTTQPPSSSSTTVVPSSSTLLTSWNTSTSFTNHPGSTIDISYPTGYSTSTPLPGSFKPPSPLHISHQPISPTPTSKPDLSPSFSLPQQRSRQKHKEVIPKQPTLPIANQDKPFNYADGFHYLIQYVKEK